MPPLRTRGMPRTGKRVALGKRSTCHQLQLTEDDQGQYDEAQRIRSKSGIRNRAVAPGRISRFGRFRRDAAHSCAVEPTKRVFLPLVSGGRAVSERQSQSDFDAPGDGGHW